MSREVEAADDRQVILRGKTFLYRQKAPFVLSGNSVHGALEYREATDEVRCHECGGWFRSVGSHLVRSHQVSARDYRLVHGLRSGVPLCGLRVSAGFRARKNIIPGTAQTAAIARASPRFKGSNSRPRSESRNETGRCQAQILDRLRRLAERHGRTPTGKEMVADGLHRSSILLAFKAKDIASVMALIDLLPRSKGDGSPHTKHYSPSLLIEILRDFWAACGRLPGKSDMRSGLVPPFPVFIYHFGSMAAAYEAAGLSKAVAA